MSRVQAVFGVITGGAGLLSLSMQPCEGAVKLKRLYHAAKDAPRTILNRVFSLKTITLALDGADSMTVTVASSSPAALWKAEETQLR